MRHFAISTVAALLLATSASATTISTLGSEDNSIIYWGLPDTAAYGQTFTLGAASTVNDVTFRIDDFGTAINYIAYVFAWGGSATTGSALSSVSGATSGTGGMASVTASLSNVLLAAGQYVVFLQATSMGEAAWGSTSSTDYSGGEFVFQNNGGDEGLFGTSNWTSGWQGPGSDLAFEINYNVPAVPLPAGLPLLAAGLGMFGLVARRRKS